VSELAFLGDTMWQLLTGVPLTVELTFISVSVGGALAVLLAVLRASFMPFAWFVRGYVFVLRGTPLLLQIFLIYYGLGQLAAVRASMLWPFLREPYWCAILALSLNTAAYGSEIIRGGLQSVPFGSVEAARVSGMSGLLLYRRIILPLAVRQALPAYGNELIAMVKSTSLASIVTLMEISGIAYAIISETYRALEVFLCAGLIYLAINFVLTRAIAGLEVWLSPHLRQAAS
jgi:octopine/nopaline transport system permease protein